MKWAQKNHFPAEVELLSQEGPVFRTSRIASIDPGLVDGVLHVGRRIERAAAMSAHNEQEELE